MQKINAGNGAITVTLLDYMLRAFGNVLHEQFGNVWRWQARKAPEFCKQSLMDDSGWNWEDQNTGSNVDGKGQVHEVSDGNEDSTGK